MDTVQKLYEMGSLDDLETLKKNAANISKITRSDEKFLKKKILDGKRSDKICIAILLYMYFLGDEGIQELRKIGVFGYWNHYTSELYRTAAVIQCVLTQTDWLTLSAINKDYFQKKAKYAWMKEYFCTTHKKIDLAIKKHHTDRKYGKYEGVMFETSFYRELVSYVDSLFLMRDKNTRKGIFFLVSLREIDCFLGTIV